MVWAVHCEATRCIGPACFSIAEWKARGFVVPKPHDKPRISNLDWIGLGWVGLVEAGLYKMLLKGFLGIVVRL